MRNAEPAPPDRNADPSPTRNADPATSPHADTERVRAVWAALAAVIDPEIRRPVTELDMIGAVVPRDGGRIALDLRLTIAGCPAAARIEANVRAAVERVVGAGQVDLTVGVMTNEQRTALVDRLRGTRPREHPFVPGGLTRVLAVTSGKGGVGKSTLTVNLAVAFAALGRRVGLIDADVHGHSIPSLLGLCPPDGTPTPPTRVGALILPPVAFGVKAISIGMFPGTDGRAVAWRGPMLHRALQQFLTDVYFGDLDILLLDLPPGTGDIAISAGHLLPHADVLVVTTPQPAAAEVAIRSGQVARQVGQRVVGVIENMAGFQTPDGATVDLFGAGGGRAVAARLSADTPDDSPVPVLGSVPVSMALRTGGDAGRPVVDDHPDDPAARVICHIAETLAPRNLAGRPLPIRPS